MIVLFQHVSSKSIFLRSLLMSNWREDLRLKQTPGIKLPTASFNQSSYSSSSRLNPLPVAVYPGLPPFPALPPLQGFSGYHASLVQTSWGFFQRANYRQLGAQRITLSMQGRANVRGDSVYLCLFVCLVHIDHSGTAVKKSWASYTEPSKWKRVLSVVCQHAFLTVRPNRWD